MTLAGREALLLTSMAYDHYVAICFPLHYPISISRRMCLLMIIGLQIMGLSNAVPTPYMPSRSLIADPGPSIISSVMSQPC